MQAAVEIGQREVGRVEAREAGGALGRGDAHERGASIDIDGQWARQQRGQGREVDQTVGALDALEPARGNADIAATEAFGLALPTEALLDGGGGEAHGVVVRISDRVDFGYAVGLNHREST